jgi:hypothetical protein
MKRALTIAACGLLLALTGAAGDATHINAPTAFLDQPQLPATGEWNMVADGVFQYLDNDGVLHRRSVGTEGLAHDIASVKAALADLSARGDGTSDLFLARHRLLRTLERYQASGVQSWQATAQVKVDCPTVYADSNIDIAGAALGVESSAGFHDGACTDYWGEGTVFAQTTGSPSQYCSDSDSGYDWDIYCAAGTALSGGCATGSAFVHWIDNADRNFYESDAAEYPLNCG